MSHILLTSNDLPALKASYEDAKENGREVFVFHGNEILVAYAKYMIEYMESVERGRNG